MELKLWLLKNKDADHDENEAMIVAATSSHKARKIASQNAEDEGAGVWLQPDFSTIQHIGVPLSSIKEGVVHTSFRAG